MPAIHAFTTNRTERYCSDIAAKRRYSENYLVRLSARKKVTLRIGRKGEPLEKNYDVCGTPQFEQHGMGGRQPRGNP